jgi:hypothetical protein
MLARLQARPERVAWIAGLLLVLIWLIIYLTTVSPTVNFIDSGELITAVHEPGIAHPPGYPLYVLMGYVASHLLWGDVAWRVNVLSAFWGALAVGAFYYLILQTTRYLLAARQPKVASQPKKKRSAKSVDPAGPGKQAPDSAATAQPAGTWLTSAAALNMLLIASGAAGASLIAASSTFWSRTAQAKMYSLHYFFIALLLILALQYRAAYERGDKQASTRWLVALAISLGLSFTNHLMTILLVLPIALLLIGGTQPGYRIRDILGRWAYLVPAFLVPLLLYAYMPLRASQDPVMNWGSTNDLGDFWRHITGWQFRPYLLGDIGKNLRDNFELITRYAFEQWGLVSIPVYLAGIAGAVLLYRIGRAILWPTLLLLVLTLTFSLFYGISEIEPYMVGFYAMFAVWIGLAPAAWLSLSMQSRRSAARQSGSRQAAVNTVDPAQSYQQAWAITALVAVAVLSSAIMIYPKQNYSQNRLAEQFALNVFDALPQNSILITDYWDFYAPTYYLQIEKGIRPDLALIDESLLRYPWYTRQLTKRYPWLMDKSEDIITGFAVEQRKWVNGEAFDANALDQSYYDLLTSFVERNAPDHPSYMLTIRPCPPSASCDNNRIASTYLRQPIGLTFKLVPPEAGEPPAPDESDYKTVGITASPVPFDDAARTNSLFYVDAYNRMNAYFQTLNMQDAAQRMAEKANAIRVAIQGR